jgi:hypothetical protein
MVVLTPHKSPVPGSNPGMSTKNRGTKMIVLETENPLINTLETGFRHSPLTNKEKID